MENLNYPAQGNMREWFECVEAERAQEWERELKAELSPCDDDLADCDLGSWANPRECQIDIGALIEWERTRPSYNEIVIKSLVGGAK